MPHLPLAGSEAGIPLTKWAAQWPRSMCQRIVQGLVQLMGQQVQFPLYCAYPATEEESAEQRAPPPLPPPVDPPGTSADTPAVTLDPFRRCPGCRRRLEMTHPLHNREPGGCRYPRTLAVHRDCPACQRGLPLSSRQHTQQGDCRALRATRRDWIGRLRVPGAPEQGGRVTLPPTTLPPGAAALPGDLLDLEQDVQEQAELQQEQDLDAQLSSWEAGALTPLITELGPIATTDQEERRLIEQTLQQTDVP
eukprot:6483503-Amphidinium_carterae.1